MTQVLLIRHGQPTYKDVEKRGFIGFGMELGQLTTLGIQQAKQVAHDPRLQGAELILSSPLTRALQTAAYVAQQVPVDIIVEPDLHEWIPDLSQQVSTRKEVIAYYDEYAANDGGYPEGETRPYETADQIRERVLKVLDRYRMYSKIIVVCHMLVIQNATGEIRRFDYCEIAEMTL